MTCPVDRIGVTAGQLKPAPRILRNLLARLSIECDFATLGCQTVVKLDLLADHCKDCEFNPKRPVECAECKLTTPKDELHEHKCIRDLRLLVLKQAVALSELEATCKGMKKEINALRDTVIRASAPSSSTSGVPVVVETYEMDDGERWSQVLPRARVTRWGGMISTPDASLQESVRKALTDSMCPQHIVHELMENSHERRWPPGLSTLEIRQMNRRVYDSYVCRKIPGRQAVVVMACDNQHVNEDMILDPGLVMIFAHGIE